MTTRTVRLTLSIATLVTAMALCWSSYHRSLIPQGLDGVVMRVSVVGGTTGRITLVKVDDRWIETDTSLVRDLEAGDWVHKDPWDTQLEVNGGFRALRPSPEILQMVLLTPLAVAAVWLLARPRSEET